MSENEYIGADGTHFIFNGGDPLPGCPESWEQAYKLQDEMNGGIKKDDSAYYDRPRWRFNCGFKLDFDGPILDVNSRFYPPKNHYGRTWDGRVTIVFMGQDVASKEFDCATLQELHSQVESYLKEIADKIKAIFQEKV
jgi:hypothetical protein